MGQIHGQVYKQMLYVEMYGPTSLIFSSCGCWGGTREVDHD